MAPDVTCPECQHPAHPADECLADVYDDLDTPWACRCQPRCLECWGTGVVIDASDREHRCRDCRGTGEAA